MIIQALCAYYDRMEQEGRVLSSAYSAIPIHYVVCLRPDGTIDHLIQWQGETGYFPKGEERPGIFAHLLDYRGRYIFGLAYENGTLYATDRTNKLKKSHGAFRERNLTFLDGLDTPLIGAYRNFLERWIPEKETENMHLLSLGQAIHTGTFAFCLEGQPDKLLQDEPCIQAKWAALYNRMQEENEIHQSQCAVTGQMRGIARVHHKIRGVKGSMACGAVLVGCNHPAECSYGNVQSYNSNISDYAMRKYTAALNMLLADGDCHKQIADTTILYWTMGTAKMEQDWLSNLFFWKEEPTNESMQKILSQLMADAQQGKITTERVLRIASMKENVDFYIMGLKPNVSRLSIKFFYHGTMADFLMGVAQHQRDLQIADRWRPISIHQILQTLSVSGKSIEESNPALLAKLLQAILSETEYPQALFYGVIQRVKLDRVPCYGIRAGILKACINRKSRLLLGKEEIQLALDKENTNPAYLCGRLFAVLEKLQKDASASQLNTTIKDTYFAAAVAKPAMVFPKLLKLAQFHLKKVNYPIYYQILLGEIIDQLVGEFPETLLLTDQGRFIIGYYQQYQSFFMKKEDREGKMDATESV